MKTQQVIQRNLPLDKSYKLIDKMYIPILEGGCICQDCGKLISNIAIVESDNKKFNVGFDCLNKLIRNNNFICNFTIEDLAKYRNEINTVIRFSKQLQETINNNPQIKGIWFEPQKYESDWFTFYYLSTELNKGGYNDSKKLKGIEYSFLHKTLSNILKITIHHGNRNS